jgi:Domain of unknown function (DUF4386)
MKKTNHRKTAVIVGILFIIATVAYSISVFILEPFQNIPNYFAIFSENKSLIAFGALLVLIDAIAVAAIGIAMYSILRKQNLPLALGYAGARIIESILFAISVIPILALVTLSQKSNIGVNDLSYYQSLGNLLMESGYWAYLIGLGVAFAISALILNFLLYQSKLVPQWISALGLLGAALVFINFLIEFFGVKPIEVLFLPIAVQEMILAVWLIAKGFNTSEINTKSIRVNNK